MVEVLGFRFLGGSYKQGLLLWLAPLCPARTLCLSLRVKGLGFKLQGLGLRVEGWKSRASGCGLRVWGLGLRVGG